MIHIISMVLARSPHPVFRAENLNTQNVLDMYLEARGSSEQSEILHEEHKFFEGLREKAKRIDLAKAEQELSPGGITPTIERQPYARIGLHILQAVLALYEEGSLIASDPRAENFYLDKKTFKNAVESFLKEAAEITKVAFF